MIFFIDLIKNPDKRDKHNEVECGTVYGELSGSLASNLRHLHAHQNYCVIFITSATLKSRWDVKNLFASI